MQCRNPHSATNEFLTAKQITIMLGFEISLKDFTYAYTVIYPSVYYSYHRWSIKANCKRKITKSDKVFKNQK